jgi:hypothetical protein
MIGERVLKQSLTPVVEISATASTPPVSASQAVRLERMIPMLVAGIVGLVALLTVTPWPVGAFQDDAIYTVLAKSLATGEGYRMLNLPGAPHATHYPPGYPFFLSLLWRLSPSFPDNIVLFKFANAVWLALAALGAQAFVRARLGWSALPSALAALSGTLAIIVLLITGVVLSEPMFMALLFPALLLSERAAETGSVRTAAAAGLICGALALIRTLGTVAVPAALLLLLWRRRFRGAAVFAIAAAIFLVPWQLWLSAYQHEIPPVLVGKYGAYGPWVAEGFAEGGAAFARDVVIANLRSIGGLLHYTFIPQQLAWIRDGLILTVCSLGATGLVVLVRRAPVTAWFLVAYGVVVLLWPFEPDRFVLALWPLLMLCGLAGVRAIWQFLPVNVLARGARVVMLGLSAAFLVGYAVINFRGYRHQWWASIQRDVGRRAKPIAEWAATATAPTDVLMTDDDLIVYLYSERRAMPTSGFLPRFRLKPPTDGDNIADVMAMIAAYSPRYYITTSAPGQRAAEALTKGDTAVLRRHRLIPKAFIYERIGQ